MYCVACVKREESVIHNQTKPSSKQVIIYFNFHVVTIFYWMFSGCTLSDNWMLLVCQMNTKISSLAGKVGQTAFTIQWMIDWYCRLVWNDTKTVFVLDVVDDYVHRWSGGTSQNYYSMLLLPESNIYIYMNTAQWQNAIIIASRLIYRCRFFFTKVCAQSGG